MRKSIAPGILRYTVVLHESYGYNNGMEGSRRERERCYRDGDCYTTLATKKGSLPTTRKKGAEMKKTHT